MTRPFEDLRPSALLQEFVDTRHRILVSDWVHDTTQARYDELLREIDFRFGALGEDE